MKRWAGAAILATILLAQAGRAEDLGKAMCSKPGTNGADARLLRNAALKGVSIEALDANEDGMVSADEIFAALTEASFCSAGRKHPCSTDDNRAVAEAQGSLSTFWESHPEVVIVNRRSPGPDEIKARPGLAAEPWGPALDEQGRFVELRCSSTAGVKGPAASATAASTGDTPANKLNLPRFLLGKDVDSLTVQRGASGTKDALKKVAQAEVSLQNDHAADTRTVAINGVAGLRLFDSPAFTLIPFAEYDRSEVRDKKADTKKLTGKLGLGAVATGFVGMDQFDFTPRFARDLADHSEVVDGRLSWRPGFLYGLKSFRDAIFFACPAKGAYGGCPAGEGLGLWSDLQLIGSLGTVLRQGDDPSLTKGHRFARAGFSASTHIYGQAGLVRDLSLDLAYKRLFRLAGDGHAIVSFKADINYWIAGSQNVSLVYGYEKSRDEETLKLTDEWKLGLGLRF